MVDSTVYRNSTASPWRPVTMRPLLRTNVGTARSKTTLPDAAIYIRRIRYTPLTPAASGGGYMPAWTDPVVAAALSCVSITACFGSMMNSANGMMQLTPGAGTSSPSGRRRSLLQSAGPVLSCTGSNCDALVASDVAATGGYVAELASATAAATVAIAATLLDGTSSILPTQISVSITSHTISGTMFLYGVPASAWSTAVQNAFVVGLAGDVIPDASQVYVTGTADASNLLNWCNWDDANGCGTPTTYDVPYATGAACPNPALPATQALYPNGIGSCAVASCGSSTSNCNAGYTVFTNVFTSTCNAVTTSGCSSAPLSGANPGGGGNISIAPLRGVLVSYVIDGYSCALVPNNTACNDGGYSLALGDAMMINSIQTGVGGVSGSQTYQAIYAALIAESPSMQLGLFGVSDESPGSAAMPGSPSISYVTAVGIAVQGEPLSATVSSNRTDILEAMLDSAINGGTLALALSGTNYSSLPATNVQAVRATRLADSAGGCPIYSAAAQPISEICSASLGQANMYKAIAIAFVVATGTLVLGFVAGMAAVLVRYKNSPLPSGSAQIPSIKLADYNS